MSQWDRHLRITVMVGLTIHGCAPALVSNPHYVVGTPYRTGLVWHYPKENFDLDATGLAGIAKGESARLTTDGEVFDQTSLAGGHATLQLPAIARVTNLENGRQVTVRINDRGAGDPRRLLEVTRRTALLLDMPLYGVVQVRLQVLPTESHAAADSLPGAPVLAMATAPRVGIETAELAPPRGARSGGGRSPTAAIEAAPALTAMTPPALRLPEAVSQTVPRPGRLIVRLDMFDEFQYAAVEQAKMATVGAKIVTVVQGRTRRFRVDVGPLSDVASADAVLDRALARGIPDARIVVD